MKLSYVSLNDLIMIHHLYQVALTSDGSQSPQASYGSVPLSQMFLHQAGT